MSRISSVQTHDSFPVVGVGASAGGIEAVTELLQGIPRDCGLAYVVVQHLDPRHESALREVLGNALGQPVAEASDGLEVEPNRIYVIPASADLEISDGRLHLRPRGQARIPHMPVDRFLRSLAIDRGNRSIAVILSGSGSDGALGVQEVKAAGGITFAQDGSARFDGMPRSAAASGAIDFVLPPQGIAAELARISRHPYVDRRLGAEESEAAVIPPVEEGALHRIIALLQTAKGVDFTSYKAGTLRRRIDRRLAVHQRKSLENYAEYLQDHPEEVEALYDDLLIHITSFFRDPEVFEFLQGSIFPEILRGCATDGEIRVWVPGCSTGEEAYSIAICLAEFLGPSNVRAKVLATDISEKVIETARAGRYLDNIAADVAPERLQKFFVKGQKGYEVARTIRERCVFARQDLTGDPPFSNLDLVSCRNLLIYFGPKLQERVIPLFHYALKPDGFLLLGTSESADRFSDLFKLRDKRFKLYAKKPIAGQRTFELPTPAFTRGAPEKGWGGEGPMKPRAGRSELDHFLLEECSPPAVLVDQDWQILQVEGDTGRFLRLPPGAARLDLLRMAREGLSSPLRAAMEEAKRSSRAVTKEGIRVGTNGAHATVDLRVVPLKAGEGGAGRRYCVLFEEPGKREDWRGSRAGGLASWLHSLSPGARGASRKAFAELTGEIEALRRELAESKAYQRTLLDEQASGNEELRAANEEALSGNEELLSTNEELETAKEELQSTNEELTTVNEELRRRNLEIAQVNDDLENLLASIEIPIIMLSSDLRIRRFTPTASNFLKLIPSDVGRPVGDLKPRINTPDLEELIEEVVRTHGVCAREVRDDGGRFHHLVIRPYRTAESKVEGAVMAIVDIDELKRKELALERSAAGLRRLAVVVRDSNDAITVQDLDGVIVAWNRGAERMYGYSEAEIIGSNAARILPEALRQEFAGMARKIDLGEIVPSFETKRITKGGIELDVWITATVLRDERGTPTGLATTERDTTERGRLIRKQIEQESLAKLGEMAAVVAHEVKNPLSGIIAALRLLGRRLTLPSTEKMIVEEGIQSASGLIDMVQDILVYARPRVPEARPVSIRALLEGAIAIASADSQFERVEVVLPASDAMVRVDIEMLRSVFLNLALNAAQAMKGSGKLEVALETGGADCRPGCCRVSFKDTGPGVPAEMRRAIFEPFFTTKRSGTGLGLPVAKRVVELHGGEISMHCPPDGGAVFSVQLPLA